MTFCTLISIYIYIYILIYKQDAAKIDKESMSDIGDFRCFIKSHVGQL